jgi:BirA family transcriptional regulator, biotin operon repressor / biotin---[acetyl-CoA-carboxylase] ligase
VPDVGVLGTLSPGIWVVPYAARVTDEVEQVPGADGEGPVWEVRRTPETTSTNADLLELARSGAREGIVLVADHQTAGRGRLDRRWEAPPGASLLLSILTRPAQPPRSLEPDQLHLVSNAVGVAAALAARRATSADVRLKWPNDLVIETDAGVRKVSGILAETVLVGGRVDALVVGIGINVNWPDDLPEELADIAISLNHVAGRELDRDALLDDLLAELGHWYGALGTYEGRGELLGRYRELSATLGRRVRVELVGETVVGDAVDVTADGHLLVVDECPDRPREIVAGDVVHLRPHDPSPPSPPPTSPSPSPV